MKQGISVWCIYCKNLGRGHEDNGRKCIQCLRDVIAEGIGDVAEPLHYEEGA